MPNNYLSVLNKHIIQVENKNVGLKVGGTNIPLPPPNQKSGGGGHMPPLSPASYASVFKWVDVMYVHETTWIQHTKKSY